MSHSVDSFVNVVFVVILVVLIFLILDDKHTKIKEECYNVCYPLQFYIKYDGGSYLCACEERSPGIIRFEGRK